MIEIKLKKWLKENLNMEYDAFKRLPEIKKAEIRGEHQRACQKEQFHAGQNWRPMTEDERNKVSEILEKEKKRHLESQLIGGTDEKNNYMALHHR